MKIFLIALVLSVSSCSPIESDAPDSPLDKIQPIQEKILFPKVSAGGNHTCGILAGKLYCWGSNLENQLGIETESAYMVTVPTQVPFPGKVTTVYTGLFNTCAFGDEHEVFCWGYSNKGQLGSTTSLTEPTRVEAFDLIAHIALGWSHTCFIRDSEVGCLGSNDSGQLGVRSEGITLTTVYPDFISEATDIAVGLEYSCALAAGVISCWGNNEYGQLGTSATQTPSRLYSPSGEPFAMLHASFLHTCAIDTEGAVYCWGRNTWGQVDGQPSETNRVTPTSVILRAKAESVAAGVGHSCALLVDGSVQCWGAKALDIPAEVEEIQATSLTSKGGHACIGFDAGHLCWGVNIYGQLGNGTVEIEVRDLPSVVSFAQ